MDRATCILAKEKQQITVKPDHLEISAHVHEPLVYILPAKLYNFLHADWLIFITRSCMIDWKAIFCAFLCILRAFFDKIFNKSKYQSEAHIKQTPMNRSLHLLYWVCSQIIE